jgi:ParB family chromosome partitioning protein
MRKALGRGLEALLPGAPPARPAAPPAPAATTAVAAPPPAAPREVPIDAVVPNPEQPRRHFDAEALNALADSIRHHGILQPLVVRPMGDAADAYELIAGERRLRAARLAGLTTVPVVFREADLARTRLELALIENVQREQLSALEEAEAYRQLIDVHGLTQDEVATQVGRSRPAVANALRLLALPDAVKAQLASGELSAGHARAVLAVPGSDEQEAFAREIVAERLPKSEAERRAAARRGAPPAARGGRPATRIDPNWRALADELTRGLGTRVKLVPRGKGGVLEIEFYSLDELDGLVARLRSAAGSRQAGGAF